MPLRRTPISAFLTESRGISVSRLSVPRHFMCGNGLCAASATPSVVQRYLTAIPFTPGRIKKMIRHLGFRPPLTAVICYLNQAIIPICTVATLIYPPLLTTIRGAYFPRLTKSRWGMPARRAPDRLAALLTAFRLVYRVLPAPDFHRRERPQSTCTRPIFILPTCQSRHTSS